MQDLSKGTDLAIAQARVLNDDAKYLYESGRPDSALALAILGLEELGKALILREAWLSTQTEWQQFWKRYTSHRAKIHTAIDFRMSLTDEATIVRIFKSGPPVIRPLETPNKFLQYLGSFRLIRESSIYTDFDDQVGRFVSPRDTPISPDVLEYVLRLVDYTAFMVESLVCTDHCRGTTEMTDDHIKRILATFTPQMRLLGHTDEEMIRERYNQLRDSLYECKKSMDDEKPIHSAE